MEDWILRGGMLLTGLGIFGRLLIIPLFRGLRALEDKVESVDTGVKKLATVEQLFRSFGDLKNDLDGAVTAMQKIVHSDEDRVAQAERELSEIRGWQRGHLEVHRQIDERVQSLEHERRSA